MLFQEMTKRADAVLIWNHPGKTVKPQKGLKTEPIIQGFFHQRITQIMPQLEKMNAQHHPKLMGPTPASALIIRLNNLFQLLPWHDLIHLVEKSFNPQRLRFYLVPHRGLHAAYSTASRYFCRGFYITSYSNPTFTDGICPECTVVTLKNLK